MKYDLKDFIELKPEKFTYIDKTFTCRRYISKDIKLFIKSDNGFNYTLIYTADEKGKGKLLYEAHHQGNYASYPLYTIEEAINKFNSLNMELNNTFLIHRSQYKNN